MTVEVGVEWLEGPGVGAEVCGTCCVMGSEVVPPRSDDAALGLKEKSAEHLVEQRGHLR